MAKKYCPGHALLPREPPRRGSSRRSRRVALRPAPPWLAAATAWHDRAHEGPRRTDRLSERPQEEVGRPASGQPRRREGPERGGRGRSEGGSARPSAVQRRRLGRDGRPGRRGFVRSLRLWGRMVRDGYFYRRAEGVGHSRDRDLLQVGRFSSGKYAINSPNSVTARKGWSPERQRVVYLLLVFSAPLLHVLFTAVHMLFLSCLARVLTLSLSLSFSLSLSLSLSVSLSLSLSGLIVCTDSQNRSRCRRGLC